MESETIISKQFYAAGDISSEVISPSIFKINNNSTKKHIERPKSIFGFMVLAATFLVLIGGSLLVLQFQPDFDQLHLERLNSTGGIIFLAITVALFLFKGGMFLYNVFLYFKYKPIESVSDELLPTCTVIVPAYNEGKLVYETLMSLAESDFPAHKLELLAIDDGSKDDTWYWIQQAKLKLGDRVSIFQQPQNKGKRHALYRGFNLGKGEIFVTVDSDSIVKKDTLRNLVSPFVVDEKCGAVAGNVQVLNNEKAILPKMLNVSFVMSFEFMRSAESSLGSVLCTPGALAAYKRTAVFACLPEWIDQTFMGQPCLLYTSDAADE